MLSVTVSFFLPLSFQERGPGGEIKKSSSIMCASSAADDSSHEALIFSSVPGRCASRAQRASTVRPEKGQEGRFRRGDRAFGAISPPENCFKVFYSSDRTYSSRFPDSHSSISKERTRRRAYPGKSLRSGRRSVFRPYARCFSSL